MRIGIYSLPFHSNYGGVLQSYALETVLKSWGHDVFVFNQDWLGKLGKRDRIERILFSLRNIFVKEKKYSKRDALNISIIELKRFWSSKMTNVVNFSDFDEIKRYELDAIIVGSDQIWRQGFCKDTKWYFLNFANSWDIKRVAYAASFGVSDWQFNEETTLELKKLIKRFNGVSVREKDAIDLCASFLDVDARFVLDPTFLLTPEDYSRLCVRQKSKGERHLVSFMLHPNIEKKNLVRNIAEKISARVVDIDVPIDRGGTIVTPYISIEEWLTEIKNADFVLTDSYHGMAFSINMNKPFVTLGNVQAGQARFTSLLDTFGLFDRMATSEDQIVALLEKEIDWERVNSKLLQMRFLSIQFLENSLI